MSATVKLPTMLQSGDCQKCHNPSALLKLCVKCAKKLCLECRCWDHECNGTKREASK